MTVTKNTTETKPIAKMRKEDGVIFVTLADNLEMTLENAKKAVTMRLQLSRGVSHPVLIDMRGLKSVTKEAREFMADEGSRLISAGALIVGSPLTRTLGNIFLWINKPKSPAKLFTDEKAALAWLRQTSNREKS